MLRVAEAYCWRERSVEKEERHVEQEVLAFRSGAATTRVKCVEAEEGLRAGATDLDMVMNISAFKEGDYERVSEDIPQVLAVANPFDVPFKVIIETGAWQPFEEGRTP